MRPFRLITLFFKASLQEEAAYRANFILSVSYSLVNLATGILGISVIFSQVEQVQGWSYSATLAILGIYLSAGALRGLFIGPGLEALAGMDGDIWTGRFDFTLLRPVDTQFLVSLNKWRPFAIFDLLLGLSVITAAMSQPGFSLSFFHLLGFLLAFLSGILVLYAILLAFAALVFWSPGVLYTWLFDGFFQLARYPVGMYPGWLRLILTWVIPIGLITTLPAQALTGSLTTLQFSLSLVLSTMLVLASSIFFRFGLRRYTSASS